MLAVEKEQFEGVMKSLEKGDKKVNEITDGHLFKKYKTAPDFARANPKVFEKEIGPVAQLVERAHGMGEARGSKPLGSTCG